MMRARDIRLGRGPVTRRRYRPNPAGWRRSVVTLAERLGLPVGIRGTDGGYHIVRTVDEFDTAVAAEELADQ